MLCSAVALIFLVSSSSSPVGTKIKRNVEAMEYHFGCSLQPTYNSGLVSFWLVGVKDGYVAYKTPISTNNFILQMLGEQKSAANKKQENLFYKHELGECFYKYYWDKDQYSPLQCFRLEDLWALRYSRNPMCPSGCTPTPTMKVDGWAANKAYPSEAQLNILREYGVEDYRDIIYGDHMFKLFVDVRDENWKSMYQSLK